MRLSRSRMVRLEAGLAGALFFSALVWSWVRGLGLVGNLPASFADVAIGFGFAFVLCLTLPFFTSTWASRVLLLRELKGVWDDILMPFGKSLTIQEIAVIAVLSGISEEMFFRGALQAEIGIVGASILFGLLHPLNVSYVIWATSVGCAFGLLYQSTGSLVPPMLAHGAYNFAALVYLRYWYQEESRDDLLLAR